MQIEIVVCFNLQTVPLFDTNWRQALAHGRDGLPFPSVFTGSLCSWSSIGCFGYTLLLTVDVQGDRVTSIVQMPA
jgi:hypothetical protein